MAAQAAALEQLRIRGEADAVARDLRDDAAPEAAAAFEALGSRGAEAGPDVVAQIDGDVVDASRPASDACDDDDDDDDQRMLVFHLTVGGVRRRAYERRPLAAKRRDLVAGCKIRVSAAVGAVEGLLSLTPETATSLGGAPAAPAAVDPRPLARDGPPKFEPLDLEAARAPDAARAARPKEKPRAAVDGLHAGERRTLRLPVAALDYDDGLRVTVGASVVAAAAPLNAYLFKAGADPEVVLSKLRPYFVGKTLSLDLEKAQDGSAVVLHNLS